MDENSAVAESISAQPVDLRVNTPIPDAPSASKRTPPSGWLSIDSAPQDGTRIIVSESGRDGGVLVYRRKTKVIDRRNLRYTDDVRWTDWFKKTDIDFEPKFYKPYLPGDPYTPPMAA